MENNAKKMLEALYNQNLETAHKFFNQALKHEEPEILAKLATELQDLGFDQEVKIIAKKLIRLNFEADHWRITLAEIAIDAGENDRALTYLAAIPSTSLDYLAALLTLADLYESQGLPEVSLDKLNEAATLAPDEPVVTLALAELQRKLGHYHHALEFYQKLNEQGMNQVAGIPLNYRLAEMLAATGDYEAALAGYRKITAHHPTADQLYEQGLLEVTLKQTEAASQTFSRLMALDSTYTSMYVPYARALMAQEDYETALQVIQQALGLDDYQPQLYSLGAEVALIMHQEKLAEKWLKLALQREPDNETIRLQLADYYLVTAKPTQVLTLTLSEDEITPDWSWRLGQAYAQLEDYSTAQSQFLRAYPLLKGNVAFMQDFITVLQSVQQPDLLKAAMQEYLKIAPHDQNMRERYERFFS